MPTRAVVLGGGMVGSAIAADLASLPLWQVTLVDSRREALERVKGRGAVVCVQADLGSSTAVAKAVAGFDVAVGALPSVLGFETLRTVLTAGVPYCDISFMSEDFAALDGLAKEKGVTAVVDCGVAPGVSHLLSGFATTLFDRTERIEILVGGLPEVRSWPYEYKAGFAPSDVIEEYTRPSRVVENGRVVVKEALSEPELIEFPGIGTLEAFNTDGLRSLVTSLAVPEMREKTLRYPGHIALMRVLRETGFFSKEPVDVGGATVRPLDLTSALLFPKWTYAEGEADLTVMRVVAEGEAGAKRVRHRWDLLDRYDARSGVRSMSRTTGYAACAMAVLIAEGAFRRPGVHPPETVGRTPGLAQAFLAEYAKRGVRVEQVTV